MKIPFSKFVVMALLALMVALPCLGISQMMVTGSPGFLLIQPEVRKELGLTPDQAAKVEKALLAFTGGTKTIRFTPGMDMASIEKSLLEPLTAGQKRRLQQLWVQQNKGRALTDPSVQKELGFSAKQKEQVDAVQVWFRDQLRGLSNGKGGPISVGKDLMTQTAEKYEAILTPEQKKKFAGMQGKPFEFKRRA